MRYAQSFVNAECALRTGLPRQNQRMAKVDPKQARRDQAERLILAREHKGLKDAVAGSRYLRDKTPTTYQHHENGTRGITRRVNDYAEAFGVSAEWLLYGRNPPSWAASDSDAAIGAIRSMPQISTVAAGRLTDPTTQIDGDFETLHISGLPPGDYFATRVEGTSMNRISPPGSTIVVNRAERELLPGRRYVFVRRGKTTYKRWENDPVMRLEPETTDPELNPTIYPRDEEEWTVIGRVRLTLMGDL